LKRLLWFVAIYAASVGALGLFALAVRAMFGRVG
jgi:hypothetical protein